jgi:hypothetical protein
MRSPPAGGIRVATGSGPIILLGVLVADRLAREGLVPHKDLWPLSARDAVGLVLAALSLLVAAGGGIGRCYCVCRKVQLHCRHFGACSLVPPTLTCVQLCKVGRDGMQLAAWPSTHAHRLSIHYLARPHAGGGALLVPILIVVFGETEIIETEFSHLICRFVWGQCDTLLHPSRCNRCHMCA